MSGVVGLIALKLDVATSTSFINFGAFSAFTCVNLCVIAMFIHVFEVLVGGDHGGRVELVRGDGGAQHVEPVEGGFGVDLVLLAGHGQAVIGDGDGEVLAGLVPADHFAGLDPDLAGALQAACLDPGDDGGEQLLGRGQQVLASAGPVRGQHRVAAGDQPLAREVTGGDLGQVLLIEQGQLQRSVVGHQLADGRGAQRGDPPVGVRLLCPVKGQRREHGPSQRFVPNVVFPAIGAVVDVYLLLHLDGKAKLLGVIWLSCGVLYLAYLTRGFRRPRPEMESVED